MSEATSTGRVRRDINRMLIEAIRTGNLNNIAQLILSGANVTRKFEGVSAIELASILNLNLEKIVSQYRQPTEENLDPYKKAKAIAGIKRAYLHNRIRSSKSSNLAREVMDKGMGVLGSTNFNTSAAALEKKSSQQQPDSPSTIASVIKAEAVTQQQPRIDI